MGKFRGRQVEVKRSMVISVRVLLTATWTVPKGAALLAGWKVTVSAGVPSEVTCQAPVFSLLW